jgi:hypothetical protein
MNFLPALLVVSLLVPATGLQTQDPPQKPKELTFEGCLSKGATEGSLLLKNAHAVGGTIAGTALQFRLIPDNEGIDLQSHLTHVVQVSGPMEGTIPAAGRTVPERELPLIRVRTVSMISNECLQR